MEVGKSKRLRILGTRGLPALHGGFETFAEHLAVYLVDRGWTVVVYCQDDGVGPIVEDQWMGVQRVRIPIAGQGPVSTIAFDWKSTIHAARSNDLCLTLGYNTAVFCLWLRLRGRINVINMDGIEWARAKWGPIAKAWFWLNDWLGCLLGNHLVADHPKICEHLSTRVAKGKITTIAYGGDRLSAVSDTPVRALGLMPNGYLTLVARAEPENSILEVVKGFSARPRGMLLVVLGKYVDDNPYHRAVKAAASDEVRFLGAIYDKPVIQALRFHCTAYVHGHQVGGTNPSLIEALGAGNAVIAHDNGFNRWVVGEAGRYFSDDTQLSLLLDSLLIDRPAMDRMGFASRRRFEEAFTWENILAQYEALLLRFAPSGTAAPHVAGAGGLSSDPHQSQAGE